MTHARPVRGLVLVLGLTAVILLVSGCSRGGEKIALQAQGLKWNTTNLQLKAKTRYTLSVANRDGTKHNFTFKAAKANKDVDKNQTTKLNFTAPGPGTYQFYCKYHPAQMTQTVTVS